VSNMVRPDWSTFRGRFQQPSFVRCSCGETLQSFNQLRDHWQFGHFDEVKKEETNTKWLYLIVKNEGVLVTDSDFAMERLAQRGDNIFRVQCDEKVGKVVEGEFGEKVEWKERQ